MKLLNSFKDSHFNSIFHGRKVSHTHTLVLEKTDPGQYHVSLFSLSRSILSWILTIIQLRDLQEDGWDVTSWTLKRRMSKFMSTYDCKLTFSLLILHLTLVVVWIRDTNLPVLTHIGSSVRGALALCCFWSQMRRSVVQFRTGLNKSCFFLVSLSLPVFILRSGMIIRNEGFDDPERWELTTLTHAISQLYQANRCGRWLPTCTSWQCGRSMENLEEVGSKWGSKWGNSANHCTNMPHTNTENNYNHGHAVLCLCQPLPLTFEHRNRISSPVSSSECLY